ncbi:response regulator transcription factor [Dyadobacter sp. CY356]|uniref:response regulator n=1 Tax=Dyadobacter sp. CY356 TaxID=2906442 RepID=UPI001F261807|nr:response regulator transcription factor [Dyadobacter sp. CY356]MCF0055084.1 response regulator transcription factor [Dyadobacter sp. CY356]
MKNILIVDDHPLVRLAVENSVIRIIQPSQTHTAGTFKEAMQVLGYQYMNLVILDLGIPGGLGVEMISQIKSLQNEARILVYSGRNEMGHATSYMAAGANGFLNKNAAEIEFEFAINTVLNNKKYVGKKV